MDKYLPEGFRKAIYGLVTAVLAILTIYGVVDAETSAEYAEHADTLLGTLASALAYYKTHWGSRKDNAKVEA